MGLPNGSAATAAPATKHWLSLFLNHPRGFWFIFWGEFAERCSYYGMMSILARYISEQLQLGEGLGATYVSIFKAACYYLPLLGGFLADRYFGKYWIIVGFSLPYILGHVILGVETVPAMFLALSLLAMGSGVIKPNISTLMGMTYDQQRPGDEHLRTSAFTIFYMAINIGAALAFFFIPLIRTHHSYWMAFLVPAMLMTVSFLLFAAGKRYYAKEVLVRHERTPAERAQQWHVVKTVGGLFLVVMFFWAVFDQSHTTWVYFAHTYTDCQLFGHHFEPEQFGTLNPVLIILLAPLGPVIFLWLEQRGIKVRATDKLLTGFVLTAVTVAVLMLAGFQAGQAEMRDKLNDGGEVVTKNGQPVQERYVKPEERVTVWYMVLAFVIITVAEILISVTGLELAFVVSPPSMKSFITGLWLASVAMGNSVINIPVGLMYPHMEPGHFFAMLTGMMAVIIVAFYFVGNWFNRKMAANSAPPVETQLSTAITATATTAEA